MGFMGKAQAIGLRFAHKGSKFHPSDGRKPHKNKGSSTAKPVGEGFRAEAEVPGRRCANFSLCALHVISAEWRTMFLGEDLR